MAGRVATPLYAASRATSVSKRFERALGKDWKIAFLFVAPIVILMATLIFWPFVNAIFLSLTVRQNRREVFVGLANYARLLADDQFTGSLANTVRFTVLSVVMKPS